jgi:hypothetical protein
MSQEQLKEIEDKLSTIEEKIGSKWTMPIIVALITGMIGIATVAIQVKLQAQQEKASKMTDRYLAAEEEARKEGKEFHAKMQTLAHDVRKHFKGRCMSSESKEDQLNEVLEKFRDLAETNRVMYGDEFTNNLQSYGEWVAEGLYDPNKINCGRENDVKFEAVARALKEFYDSRCIVRIAHEERLFGL